MWLRARSVSTPSIAIWHVLMRVFTFKINSTQLMQHTMIKFNMEYSYKISGLILEVPMLKM